MVQCHSIFHYHHHIHDQSVSRISDFISNHGFCTKHLLRINKPVACAVKSFFVSHCVLETNQYPHAILFKTSGSSERPVPVISRFGRGAEHDLYLLYLYLRAATGVQSKCMETRFIAMMLKLRSLP